MKQKLTLLLIALVIALVTSMGAWATDVIWESLHGWTQSSGGVGSFNWYGVHTPGDNSITYSMSSIQLKQSSGNNNTNYLAIATTSPGSNSTIAEANVLAVSSNAIKATASTLYEYTYSSSVNLTGGTTYYLVFVTANTPTDGVYTIQSGRMEVNHLNCYAYSYGNNANVDWFPYFKATLTTTNSTKHYSYSCKNLAGYFLSSGYLLQNTDPTTGDAPSIAGYTCQSASVDATGVVFTYALTSNPLASATTAAGDIATKPKYTIIESKAGGYVYYTEAGGAVKAWSDQDGDKTHWIVVGDEANGYKLYNALTGTSNVAVVADGNDKPIQMLAEASNTASLFDIRYISDAYRLYKKGTKYCTNRLSSSSRLVGIHTNVNDGSKVDVSRYSKTITYKLKWGDVEKASESVNVPTGDDPADYLPWNYPYCNLTCDVDAVTTETSTVNVTMTWDGPFEFSTDFASAKWYCLKLNNKYVYYQTESPNHLLFSATKMEEPNALWAFFGNPIDGVRVANLYSGEGLFISNNDPAIMHNSTYVTNMIGSNAYGFTLHDGAYYIADVDGSGVSSSNGAAAPESSNATMKVEVPYKYLSLSFIDEYTKDKIGGYFEPTQSAVDALKSLYENASSVESSDYNNLKSYIIAQLAVQGDGFLYPSTGYYRIKNNGTGNYLAYGTPTASGTTRPAGLIATLVARGLIN